VATDSPLPEALAGVSRHLFLSPHYDDIPLSAGATVRLLAENGTRPETRVVFGSEPDHAQPLTAFAQAMHEAWGLTAEEVIAARQAEEQTAAAILGASTAILPFRDAIYRGEAYLSNDDLFGTPASVEKSLPSEIITSLDLGERPDPTLRIYAPLGVGRHVDHQIVHQVGVDMAAAGWDVWFYEDIPYALKPNALRSRLEEVSAVRQIASAARVSAGATWDAKLDAILSYPSQLETVFLNYVGVGTSREEISAALRDYALRAGDGVVAEHYWRILDASSEKGS
jgi:LmbE family N-acetylglucosaminyl deacetylase